jgi:hypothetical protein
VTVDDRIAVLRSRIEYLADVWREARRHNVLAETVASLRDELERADRELLRLTRALKEEVGRDVWNAAISRGMRAKKTRAT